MHIFTLQGPVHIIRENQILESGVSRRFQTVHPGCEGKAFLSRVQRRSLDPKILNILCSGINLTKEILFYK